MKLILAMVVGSVMFPLTSTGQQSFSQMVETFGRDPQNVELQKQIILAARNQTPMPKVSSEAVRLVENANAKLKGQPTNEQKRSAAADLLKAVSLAPWWGNAMFNLGYAYERLDQLGMANRMYALYILTEPSPLEIAQAQSRIKIVAGREDEIFQKVKANTLSSDLLLDALEGATYDCGQDERYYFRTVIRERFPAAQPLEHTPPKAVNGLMPAGLAPSPAFDRKGLVFTALGPVYTLTVTPEQIVNAGKDGSVNRACKRIRTF